MTTLSTKNDPKPGAANGRTMQQIVDEYFALRVRADRHDDFLSRVETRRMSDLKDEYLQKRAESPEGEAAEPYWYSKKDDLDNFNHIYALLQIERIDVHLEADLNAQKSFCPYHFSRFEGKERYVTSVKGAGELCETCFSEFVAMVENS